MILSSGLSEKENNDRILCLGYCLTVVATKMPHSKMKA